MFAMLHGGSGIPAETVHLRCEGSLKFEEYFQIILSYIVRLENLYCWISSRNIQRLAKITFVKDNEMKRLTPIDTNS